MFDPFLSIKKANKLLECVTTSINPLDSTVVKLTFDKLKNENLNQICEGRVPCFAPSGSLAASNINQLSHWWWRCVWRKEDDHTGVYYEAGPRNRLGLSGSSTAASCFHLTFSSRCCLAVPTLNCGDSCDVCVSFLLSLSITPL